jgi:aryl-alcohol dehydrogenase-like predicted oxidoreductase
MSPVPTTDSAQTALRIGLGLAALGRPGYINLGHGSDLPENHAVEAMRLHAWNVLDAAYASGVRYYDAARSYGRAEEFLSGWLTNRDISDVFVGSKWGYTYTANWSVDAAVHEVKDHTLPTLRSQWVESLRAVGPWLRYYQIHSATESSGVLDRDDVLDELASLRDGQSVAIGLTLSGPDSRRTLERAMGIERGGERLFHVVQATWNILEPSLSDILASAANDGMVVIVKEALANGRLTDRNVAPAFAPRRAVLERVASRLGCTLDQLALATVLDQPWATSVLSGAATIEQLHSNLGALSVTLDDEACATIASVAEPVEEYWQTRAQLAWN